MANSFGCEFGDGTFPSGCCRFILAYASGVYSDPGLLLEARGAGFRGMDGARLRSVSREEWLLGFVCTLCAMLESALSPWSPMAGLGELPGGDRGGLLMMEVLFGQPI